MFGNKQSVGLQTFHSKHRGKYSAQRLAKTPKTET
ncbi:hypothetical protein SNOG_16042 [Parastagonospora nodorum SN15]|uniref:Uncharacterized protein n=1 Tax=Phaeosphaeria nodorum (strain SN15 / ATCC MYA-4574 / FGSC 10173) TaxID=321614 RepID=Q0TWW2_PHANO|nr:hypothetical protein SNOG_16042 [Parastagonospora nodorum SN15]EAT76621.1 hypothetical protein SNOG_16042 [Parastagonospora nodorum SN15]